MVITVDEIQCISYLSLVIHLLFTFSSSFIFAHLHSPSLVDQTIVIKLAHSMRVMIALESIVLCVEGTDSS